MSSEKWQVWITARQENSLSLVLGAKSSNHSNKSNTLEEFLGYMLKIYYNSL